ncbi:sigma-70 family RNA polymerase sigma factor [Lacisediminimonas sp.]|uniref:sigma-70 family RNA polymerase sigma factor n=1 Tax=Lacisediminimonas sp. TaxID=3060582 RepID=UPI00271E1CA2|nr:sigma-70 family RNA polymerase sigma factor [Lacisediminimonas sp.]MDO8299371.1 sigma-70 family RNA polymerase sigma factor [Lacisediminimonas sp.]
MTPIDGTGMTATYLQQLESMRPALLRFAILQLRNESMAEDVVQESLVAVLEKPQQYAGRASLRTYVTGILKHKILDTLRRNSRLQALPDEDGQQDDDAIDALFNASGHVLAMPRDWGDPDAALHQKDFFRVMELCLEKLPPATARIFMMREWLEMETAEICKELEISPSNAWVMLYRARVRLRECLDLNWFGVKDKD